MLGFVPDTLKYDAEPDPAKSLFRWGGIVLMCFYGETFELKVEFNFLLIPLTITISRY